MKRISLLWLLMAAALVCATAPSSYAQEPQGERPFPGYSKSIPLRNLDTGETMTPSAAIAAVNAASTNTIPLFNYSLISPVDSHTYSGMIVGRNPLFHGARTTSVTTVVIPLILKVEESNHTVDTYDPTALDPSCSPSGSALTLVQNSPIFNTSDIHMGGTDIGTTTYPDAFQRGEFWSNVSVTGNAYHTLLAASTVSPVTVTVPLADGQSYPPSAFSQTPCEPLAVLDVNYVNNTLLPGLISSLASKGVSPTTVPLFLIYNVVMSASGTSPFNNNCCILGFHSGFQKSGQGQQFYGITDFDTTGFFGGDISVTTHEIGELLNDPTGVNATPAWGHIGQVPGCQNNFEVGDPLTGTFFPAITMNSFTYHPQELVFFSWFFRQSPSLGVNGWFSDNNSFASSQSTVCQ